MFNRRVHNAPRQAQQRQKRLSLLLRHAQLGGIRLPDSSDVVVDLLTHDHFVGVLSEPADLASMIETNDRGRFVFIVRDGVCCRNLEAVQILQNHQHLRTCFIAAFSGHYPGIMRQPPPEILRYVRQQDIPHLGMIVHGTYVGYAAGILDRGLLPEGPTGEWHATHCLPWRHVKTVHPHMV
mgnify:CR=1 FL=1